MALVNCPECKKRISSKSKSCPHCQLNLVDLTEEDLKKVSLKRKRKTRDQVMSQNYIAVLMVLVGFSYTYWKSPQPESIPYYACMASIMIGCLIYVVNRVRLAFLK